MQHSSSTHALSATILALLLGTACSSSSDGTDTSGVGGIGSNGGSVGTPGAGGSSVSNPSSSGGSTLSGKGGNLSNGGASATNGGQTAISLGGASNGGSNATTGGKAANAGGTSAGGNASGGKSNSVGGASTGGKSSALGGSGAGGAASGGRASGGSANGGKAAGGAASGGAPAGGKSSVGGAASGGKTASGGAPGSGGASSGVVSCNTTLPAAKGTKTLSSPQPVSGSFDGGMVQYCGTGSLGSGGDAEGQDPLFNIANGGTLKNVIIGGPGCSAADGVHCAGSCTLENVWWGDVGEDAATFRGGATKVVINGGGAFNASDKVFQDNTTGGDLVTINNFFVSTAGKLYRSCGTCANDDRHVVIQNVAYKGVSQLVGLNTNNGDTAKISGLIDCGGNGTICAAYTWVGEGEDPPRNGTCSY